MEGAGETPTRHNDFKYVYDLGLGMQETLEFLYSQRPDLTGFLQWANDNGMMPATDAAAVADTLSATDLEHWNEHGFVLIKEAVTIQEYSAATRAIWEFLGADPSDPETWYKHHPAKEGLMLVFTQHEALHTIRNSPKIRKAYEQLYGTTEIYKIVDKLSFNPPELAHYKFAGSPLHWDTSLELPVPDKFQGLLYLNDISTEGGAFHCVPGFHRDMKQWLESLPAGTDPRQYAKDNLQPVTVTGNAGDFIIWHQALPHCASPNRSQRPRLVQYLTYIPDNFEDHRPWK
jgi:hypothetical protein